MGIGTALFGNVASGLFSGAVSHQMTAQDEEFNGRYYDYLDNPLGYEQAAKSQQAAQNYYSAQSLEALKSNLALGAAAAAGQQKAFAAEATITKPFLYVYDDEPEPVPEPVKPKLGVLDCLLVQGRKFR